MNQTTQTTQANLNPLIPNGCWTISGPRGHRTFDVSTQSEKEEFAPGKRIVALLTGPDNTATGDWTSFGFVSDHGDRINVWKKYRGSPDHPSEHEAYAKMLPFLFGCPPEGGAHINGAIYAIQGEKTCLRCNRRLTTPQSLADGIGPECKAKSGGAA